MMQFLALCLVICGLARGAPADSYGKRVFDLDVLEAGNGFREVVEVDMDKGVVHISVPAHNELDHTEFYFDFNTNRSVQVLPEKEICFVAELPKLPTIKQLVNNLESAKNQGPSTYSSSYIRRINDMIVNIPVINRDFLGYLKDACPPEYPLYNVVPMNDHIVVKEETGNVNTATNSMIPTSLPAITVAPVIRQKRAVQFAFTFDCPILLARMKCRLTGGRSCFYVYQLCSQFSPNDFCKEHVYTTNYVCRPCCDSPGHDQDCAVVTV